MEFWNEQEDIFVDTPVVKVISKILESENSILIVGEPGIGKSMLLHHVALKLQKKIDYHIIPCSCIQDILQHYKGDTTQMFVLDDICGRFTVSLSDIEHWIKNEDTFKRILKKGKTKIAATCRLDIYRDEKFQESFTVFKSNILNLSAEYSRDDKLAICKKYLSETDIQLLKDQNVNFTPLMCYLHSKNENFNLTDFLTSPFETYKNEWNKLKAIDPYKYCSLFFFVIYNGIMKESFFDTYNDKNIKHKSVLKNIFDTCEINRGTPRNRIKTILNSMIGTYVRKTKNEYRVIHDQMFDFMCSYFGNKDIMVRCILRYSDIRVFNERTQLESVNKQHGKFTIMISRKFENEYFERIKSELQLGRLNQCFYNTQMKYEVYRTSFLNILKTIDDKLLISQIYQRQKNRLNLRHADDIQTKQSENFSDDNDDDEDDSIKHFLNETPFIISCLRGYYNIFQYLISKGVDIKIHEFLIAACKGGNEKIVQLLIDKGSHVNQYGRGRETPLTIACKGGNEKLVQLLIDKGSKVNQADGLGLTPLIIACKGGNEKIVQLLISKGSVVNYSNRTSTEQTPLITACSRGHYKIVKLLIDKAADVNETGSCSQTPLILACKGGNYKIVKLLIKKGSYVNLADFWGQTPLTIACYGRSEKIVQLLRDKGSYCMLQTLLTNACEIGDKDIARILIEESSDVYQTDRWGHTLLTSACKVGNEKIVQLLIHIGSDVNQVNGIGQTPLTIACKEGHEKIVQFLIHRGSDVNQVNGIGQTPLTAACKGGHEKIIKLLIHNGSQVNQVGGMGLTALTAACKEGNEKIIQLLIDKGSEVNYVDSMEQTPLIAACYGGNEKTVQLLLDKGSEVNQVGGSQWTPLTAACSKENEKIVQLLLDKGSDVNQASVYGQTPLGTAVERGNGKIVQLLIDKGCDVNKADANGDTPLTISCNIENERLVQLFIYKGCNVNQAGANGDTPLTISCNIENEKIVQLLIDKGSDVNKADADGDTPLTISRMIGNKKILQLLLDKERKVNQADGIEHIHWHKSLARK